MNKKKLLSVALVAIMIAILSFSTLAWFSDSDSVTNNFQVAGGENENPDEIFSLDVKERVEDGKVVIGEDKDPNKVDSYTYENILPGDMLYKNPSAQNTGAYAQHVRFKVTIDNANDWVAVMQKYGYELHDLFYLKDKATKLTESADWTFAVKETTVENDQVTYVFYLNEVLEPQAWVDLFTYVKIPHQLTQNDMALFTEGKFQMVIKGEAIQVDNIEAATAQEAFAIVEADQVIG